MQSLLLISIHQKTVFWFCLFSEYAFVGERWLGGLPKEVERCPKLGGSVFPQR